MTNDEVLKDWRFQGQDKYLMGIALKLKRYEIRNPSWDHDHCEFCGDKFMVTNEDGSLTEGYTTEDEYRWICKTCFNDFKDFFKWI